MKRIMFVLWLGIIFFTSNAQEWKVDLNDTAPSFTVYNKDGKAIDSQSLRGKVVLLNFFATWCPPCREELPRLQKEIYDRWSAREDFEVMVLAREEDWDKLDPFIKKTGYTFPIYPDLKRGVFSLFADSFIPRNVLIDKEGKIIYQSVGYTEKEFTAFIAMIERSLGE